MKLITQRDLIRDVANHWYRAYKSQIDGIDDDLYPKQQIYQELRALDLETATTEQVNEIIGNGSWTILYCNECKREVTAVVEVGQKPDWESRTAHLCLDCMKKARDLADLGSAK